MKQEIIAAENFFDANFCIGTKDLDKVVGTALGQKADYADLFFEYSKNEGVSLEEGLVKSCSQSTANGVGVRVHCELPFSMREQISAIALRQLELLNDTIALLEQRLIE